jgi:dCMP deaminase
MSERWDTYFLEIAAVTARMSKDPSSQVGAVAVLDRRILATGFNGFPAGVRDDERLQDRETKYPRIVHAEQNVIAWAARRGVALGGASLYVYPYHPCADCAKLIAQAGVFEVVIADGETPARWEESFSLAAGVLLEAGVRVRRVRYDG